LIKSALNKDNLEKELSKQTYENHDINIYVHDIDKNNKKISIRDNKSQYLCETVNIENLKEMIEFGFLKLNN